MGDLLQSKCPVCNLAMPGPDHNMYEEEVVVCSRCTEEVHVGCMDDVIFEMCKTCWEKEPIDEYAEGDDEDDDES